MGSCNPAWRSHVWSLPDGWEEGKPCFCGVHVLGPRRRRADEAQRHEVERDLWEQERHAHGQEVGMLMSEAQRHGAVVAGLEAERDALLENASKLICSYCGLVQTAASPAWEDKVPLAVDHMLACDKRPEITLLAERDALAPRVTELEGALQEQRRQMAYPDLPPAFAATMIRLIDRALAPRPETGGK